MSDKISSLYTSLMLGALFVIGFSLTQADLFGNYGKSTSDLSYLNVTSDVINQTSNIKDSIENTVITGIQPLDQFIASTYQTVKLLFGVIDIYNSFVSDVASLLGLPAEFGGILITVIMTIITLVVIFAIIRIITHEQV